MDDIFFCGTLSTPEIDFRFSENRFAIKGDAYPENALELYAGAIDALRQHLASIHGRNLCVDLRIGYFNSAATKMVHTILDLFDGAKVNNNSVTIDCPSRAKLYDLCLPI